MIQWLFFFIIIFLFIVFTNDNYFSKLLLNDEKNIIEKNEKKIKKEKNEKYLYFIIFIILSIILLLIIIKILLFFGKKIIKNNNNFKKKKIITKKISSEKNKINELSNIIDDDNGENNDIFFYPENELDDWKKKLNEFIRLKFRIITEKEYGDYFFVGHFKKEEEIRENNDYEGEFLEKLINKNSYIKQNNQKRKEKKEETDFFTIVQKPKNKRYDYKIISKAFEPNFDLLNLKITPIIRMNLFGKIKENEDEIIKMLESQDLRLTKEELDEIKDYCNLEVQEITTKKFFFKEEPLITRNLTEEQIKNVKIEKLRIMNNDFCKKLKNLINKDNSINKEVRELLKLRKKKFQIAFYHEHEDEFSGNKEKTNIFVDDYYTISLNIEKIEEIINFFESKNKKIPTFYINVIKEVIHEINDDIIII